MSQQWEAIKAPEGQYSPAYYVHVKGCPDVVADVYEVNGSADHAHLIAAAPDLLEALEEIESLVTIESEPLGKIARAAINKAKSNADPT